jgi:hypothetical protein
MWDVLSLMQNKSMRKFLSLEPLKVTIRFLDKMPHSLTPFVFLWKWEGLPTGNNLENTVYYFDS